MVSSLSGRGARFFYRARVRSVHVAAPEKARPALPANMRRDTEAVGGFFEDLPVLAFVLAGVLSVAGTACWTGEQARESGLEVSLERSADLLITSVVLSLTGTSATPSMDSIRCAELSEAFCCLDQWEAALVSVWCVHPASEPLLVVSTTDGEPGLASHQRVFLNALFPGGTVGIVEVRVLVWASSQG